MVSLEKFRKNRAICSMSNNFSSEAAVTGSVINSNPDLLNIPTAENNPQIDFRQLIGDSPVAYFTCDKDGFITYYNESAAELWGRRPTIGKDKWNGALKIFKPDGHTQVAHGDCPMAEAIKEGREIKEFKMIFERPDGSRRVVLPHPKPIFDSSGAVSGAYNVLIDITDQEEYHQKIIKSSADLQAIFQSSKEGYGLIDRDGVILAFNDVCQQLYREVMGKELKTGSSLFDIVPAYYRSNMEMALQAVLQGQSFERKSKHLGVDGNEYWMRGNYNPVRTADGTITGICLGISDITAEMQVEEILRESEERFRTVADTAPVLIWMAGVDKLCNFFNKRWLDFRGRSMEEELGNGWAEGVHPEDFDRCLEIYFTSFDARKEFKMEYRLKRFDGDYRWISDTGIPRFSPDGMFLGYIGSCVEVHEQRQAEEILRESEEFFRTVADNAPVMIWTAKPDMQRDFFNKEWLTFTGRSIEQERGSGWIADVHPDDLHGFLDLYNTAFTDHKSYSTLYRVRRHDGEYRWVSAAGIPRFSSDGSFLGLVGSCMDVTEQQHAREELGRLVAKRTAELQRKNEELQRQKEFVDTIINSSIDNITVIDKEMRYLAANKQVEKTIGLSRSELIGKRIDEVFPAVKNAEVYHQIERTLGGEYIHDINYSSFINGRHFDVHFVPLRENDEVFACLIISHDTTEIVQISEQLKETNTALEEKNKTLERQTKFIETTLDASIDQICVYDREGKFLMANQSFLQMSRKTEEEIIGKSMTEIFPFLEGSEIQTGLLNALKGKRSEDIIWRSPQTENIYNIFAIPLIENNSLFGAMVVAHDDTSILKASQKIKENNEELKQINSELEQFAYVASHDLQEPLRKIKMFSGRLSDRKLPNADPNEQLYLNKIINASDRMTQLINDLLNYSKLTNSTDGFDTVDLNDVLSTTLADLDLIIEEKHAVITADPLPTIDGIELQMNQLFHNLIGNGLKFSKKDIPPVIHIGASIAAEQDIVSHGLSPEVPYHKLTISDNGIGFDQEYAKKIFVVFQRLNSRDEYAGTGIGLALCHKIVTFHNGALFATAKLGEGATFTILLPKKQKTKRLHNK